MAHVRQVSLGELQEGKAVSEVLFSAGWLHILGYTSEENAPASEALPNIQISLFSGFSINP